MRDKLQRAKIFVTNHRGPLLFWAALTTVSVVQQQVLLNSIKNIKVQVLLVPKDNLPKL